MLTNCSFMSPHLAHFPLFSTHSPHLSTNQRLELVRDNQSEVSISTRQPIRGQYQSVTINQKLVLQVDNLSEVSIVGRQPIRGQYQFVTTNQRLVLVCDNQTEVSIVLCPPIRGQYWFVTANQRLELVSDNQSEIRIVLKRQIISKYLPDVITMLHFLLQTVHTLARHSQRFIFTILDLPLQH